MFREMHGQGEGLGQGIELAITTFKRVVAPQRLFIFHPTYEPALLEPLLATAVQEESLSDRVAPP